jgi:Domain of Unknown Function (DUF1259)
MTDSRGRVGLRCPPFAPGSSAKAGGLGKAATTSAVLMFATVLAAPVFAADGGWQAQIGKALGKAGANMPGGVYRVGLPRTDLKATLYGVTLMPGFALGGWLAFEKIGD